jgi:hypothetical protein
MEIDYGSFGGPTETDIRWSPAGAGMVPLNGAGIINLGVGVDIGSITPDQLVQYTYSTTPVPASQIVADDAFAVHTTMGNFSILQVQSRSGIDTLQLRLVLYSLRDCFSDAYTIWKQKIPTPPPTPYVMYISDNILPPYTTVHQWGSPTETRTYTTGGSAEWLLMLDDPPEANWEHPVTYYFVNPVTQAIDGEYHAFTPPAGIGTVIVDGTVPVTGTGATKVSSGTKSLAVGGSFLNSVTLGEGSPSVTGSCSNLQCSRCFALLISGGVEPARNYARYYTDMSNMYKTLIAYPYCYPKDNIYVLMSDGDGVTGGQDQCSTPSCSQYVSSNPDLDGDTYTEPHYSAATLSTLTSTFTALNARLNADPQSTLFIFTTNHGGNDTTPRSGRARLYLWGTDQFIWDSDFVNYLSATPRAITMTMEQCYGGGFIDNFATYSYSGTQKRVITTAASADESSRGNDFSAAWITGVAGAGPANFPVNNGNNDQLISYAEAFYYARAHDLSALGSSPLEHPQTSGGSRKDNQTLGLSSCTICSGVVPIGSVTPRDATTPADGLYEDINNDGATNRADAAFFFAHMGDIKTSEPTCAFDFNGNGFIDFGDIVTLYNKYSS